MKVETNNQEFIAIEGPAGRSGPAGRGLIFGGNSQAGTGSGVGG